MSNSFKQLQMECVELTAKLVELQKAAKSDEEKAQPIHLICSMVTAFLEICVKEGGYENFFEIFREETLERLNKIKEIAGLIKLIQNT